MPPQDRCDGLRKRLLVPYEFRRQWHVRQVGVWTGTDLLIWGGALFRPETNGRYNPATDLAPFSNANAPSWRNGHNLVWTGTELIVWGGWGGSYTDNVFNTGGRYNPLTDTWSATSQVNAPAARGRDCRVDGQRDDCVGWR